MWNVYHNDNNDNDGQRTNCDQKSSLEPLAQVSQKKEEIWSCKFINNTNGIKLYRSMLHSVTERDKRPMGHIAHLRNQFKSINTFEKRYMMYDYIITLIRRGKNQKKSEKLTRAISWGELKMRGNEWNIPFCCNSETLVPKTITPRLIIGSRRLQRTTSRQ